MFDYITGITIGSIAAELATNLEEFEKPLIAMIVYGLVACCISIVTCKSLALRKFFSGKPVVLYENGKLYEKNLGAAKMDINEFLTQCRVAGYFDLAQLQTAVLETNGQVSFLPLEAERPATPKDLNMDLPVKTPTVSIIIDGHVLPENLKATGNDDVWLKHQLEAQHARQADVFFATCDTQNTLTLYRRTGEKVEREIFE